MGVIFFLGIAGQVNAQVEFLYKFGTFGTGVGQLQFPAGVTIDSSGNIIVADTWNHRVQVFDSSGTHLNTFGINGTGNGQFIWPLGITVNSSGNIIVADTWNDRVQVFDSSGTHLNTFGSNGFGNGELILPSAVAVDSLDEIIVVDSGNGRIQVFDSGGEFLREFGSFGTGNGQFVYPYGVSVDGSDNIIVTDWDGHQVLVFDSSGTLLNTFGANGTGDGQFQNPAGVEVDGSGNIIVADYDNHRIQVFDSEGNFHSKFGSFGNGDGEFNNPCDVAVDGSGNIIVADFLNSRIQLFGIISTAPMAIASVDKSVVDVGDTVFLDGSNSSDPDGDPLVFNWTFTSIPSGSTAVLDDPTSVFPTFTADVAGNYVVCLSVNDGTVNSAPDEITITAEAQIADPILMVQACIDEINGLAPRLFNDPNNKKALINKLNAVIHKLKNGEYKGASKKLENDILKKTDGCTLNGKPDKNDWIKDCASQDTIYPLLLDVIKLL